jgi:hypothetical protein
VNADRERPSHTTTRDRWAETGIEGGQAEASDRRPDGPVKGRARLAVAITGSRGYDQIGNRIDLSNSPIFSSIVVFVRSAHEIAAEPAAQPDAFNETGPAPLSSG